ncbi:uncharacterized protein LOC143277361 [Babylonia areolata]|uniref:uncharacterized protein LOC143277361 n=1 Tax=Babylonia areolata TaxID=304850 RepID=UPI003FD2DC07
MSLRVPRLHTGPCAACGARLLQTHSWFGCAKVSLRPWTGDRHSMGLYSVDYCADGESTVPKFTSAIVFVVMSFVVEAVLDGEVGRTFILNHNHLPWENASQTCRDMNGTLAKIDHIYVIPDMGFADAWTLWVGLKINSTKPAWEDGAGVNWTNWYGPMGWRQGKDPVCTAAVTPLRYGFVWLAKDCNEALPSLCEVPGGTCRFNVTYHATLTGFNDKMESLSREECQESCRTMRDIDCRSFDAHRESQVCQMSRETRWSQPQDFVLAIQYWDYYHWTCIEGTYLNGEYGIPNGVELPTTPEITTSVSTEPSTAVENSTVSEEMVCFKVKPPTENETEEIQKEVEELQTMTEVYKEHNKLKKKTSRSDPRGSAATVGSVAVGLVVTIFLLIVLSDIISCPQHLRQMNKRGAPWGRWYRRLKRRRRRKKQQKAMQFTEYGEGKGTSASQGPLVLSARVPRSFQPQGLQADDTVEHVYSNGLQSQNGQLPVNRKLEQHLERIRQLELQFGGGLRKSSKMAVSCPNLDKMDTAIPGMTDTQGGSDAQQGEERCHPFSGGGNLGMKTAGGPRIRIMRLGSRESGEVRTDPIQCENLNQCEDHNQCEDLNQCEEDPNQCEDHNQCKDENTVVSPSPVLFSRPNITCPDDAESSQSEEVDGSSKRTHFFISLQNGQVPVLNTSEHIELSEFKNLLHSQQPSRARAKDRDPVSGSGSENLFMQVEVEPEHQGCESDNEREQGEAERQPNESQAASETISPASSSPPTPRPQVEIWIEEDHTPTSEEHLTSSTIVNNKLLRVREYPHSFKHFKQQVQTKHSSETPSDKIINTE